LIILTTETSLSLLQGGTAVISEIELVTGLDTAGSTVLIDQFLRTTDSIDVESSSTTARLSSNVPTIVRAALEGDDLTTDIGIENTLGRTAISIGGVDHASLGTATDVNIVLVTRAANFSRTGRVENVLTGRTADLGTGVIDRVPCASTRATFIGSGLLRIDDSSGTAVRLLIVGVSIGTARIVGSVNLRRIGTATLLTSSRILGDGIDGTARSSWAEVLGVWLRAAKDKLYARGKLVTSGNLVSSRTASIGHVLLGRIGDTTRILSDNPTSTIGGSSSTRRIVRRTTERTSRIGKIDSLLGRTTVGSSTATEGLKRA